jgi:hypothetical protein
MNIMIYRIYNKKSKGMYLYRVSKHMSESMK